jgi:hypothetical protein
LLDLRGAVDVVQAQLRSGEKFPLVNVNVTTLNSE